MKTTLSDKSPMVSVAMVTYNQANLIERAIKGVVRQRTSFPIELIIMDDASPDNTYRIAEKWQRKYPHIIRLYRNERNIGLQANYMRAFSHCRGQYLAMCDADDYWCDRSKLRRQVEYMEQHPECAITFHRVINHYAGTGTKSLSNPGQPADCGIRELSQGNFITNCSVVYRRELVNLNQLPEWMTKDCWPDYPLHMLYARHGKIHYIPRPMAVYRQGGSGAWTAAAEYERQLKAYNVRRHLLDEFQDVTEATEGLHTAIKAILVAMCASAPDENKMKYVRDILADEYGCDTKTINRAITTRKTRKSIKSRILTAGRKVVSLFIPLPRP